VSPSTAIVNAGKSRIMGTEIDATIAPVKNLTINASWSYLATKLISETAPTVPAGYGLLFTSLPGHALPFTPMNKLQINATYVLPVPDTYGKLSVGATYVIQSKELTSISSPYGRTDDLGLLNFNFNWIAIMGSQVDGSVFVTNVTNYKYDTFTPGLYNAFGFESRGLGEPRMFGIRLRYNFGE